MPDIILGGETFYNVPALVADKDGGGSVEFGYNWEHVKTVNLGSISTSSTTASTVTTIATDSSLWTSSAYILVQIRDTAGLRIGYFYGTDSFFVNYAPLIGTSSISVAARFCMRGDSANDRLTGVMQSYGVWASQLDSAGTITISKRYSSSYTETVNGTFEARIYKLNLATDMVIFDNIN